MSLTKRAELRAWYRKITEDGRKPFNKTQLKSFIQVKPDEARKMGFCSKNPMLLKAFFDKHDFDHDGEISEKEFLASLGFGVDMNQKFEMEAAQRLVFETKRQLDWKPNEHKATARQMQLREDGFRRQGRDGKMYHAAHHNVQHHYLQNVLGLRKGDQSKKKHH
jgi:hypothetical protein